MSDNHEEILANFQSITAIDDVGEAILHLEECNWDLYAAIHRVLPQDNAPPQFAAFQEDPVALNVGRFEELNNLDVVPIPDEHMTIPSAPNRSAFRNIYGPDLTAPNRVASLTPIDLLGGYNNTAAAGCPTAVASNSSGPGSSSANPSASSGSARTRPKDVLFNIHHRFEVFQITISNQATVGELKAKIMDATQIPVCRQALSGWLANDRPCVNATVLHTLNIARENELFLTDLSAEGFDDDASVQRQSEPFTLIIRHLPEDTEIKLNFPGHMKILQIKSNLFNITDIPVRHQEWTGWPSNITNDTMLTQTGIARVHNLTLRSAAPVASHLHASLSAASNATNYLTAGAGSTQSSVSRRPSNNSNVIEIDSDESEFEDATDADFNADEDMFTETVVRNRLNHLISDNIDDEKLGSLQFVENYVQRYGDPHPDFFIGNLEEALNEACHKPAKDRKLLAIYLHHDGSVLTNVFCDQLLKCDSIAQMLHHNYVLYGWDLTYESNKNLFLSALSCVGMTATIMVRNLQTGQLPAILVIGKTRSTCEVLSMIHSNLSREELLNKLIDTVNMYSDQREVEVREESERAAREQMKMEQDEAYYESLEADRLKEEAKRQKEHAMQTERKRAESERQEQEALREANRLDAEQEVPPEPAIGEPGCTKIRVRQPTGEFFERRFLGTSPLRHLLKYVASKGYPTEEFKLISSFPRRDLTSMESSETLAHYKLCPQETVTLEER